MMLISWRNSGIDQFAKGHRPLAVLPGLDRKILRPCSRLGLIKAFWICLCGCFALFMGLSAGAQESSSGQVTPVLQVAQSSGDADLSAELYMLVQQLQQEVRELRGQIEELSYRQNQASKQERDRYVDLDRRILELRDELEKQSNSSVNTATSGQTATGVTPSIGQTSLEVEPAGEVSDDARQAYELAYNLIKQRKYDEAVTSLHSFINDYPSSDLAPNAYYWLGEVYLVLPKLEQARQAFIVVIGKYPNHRKAPDASYKLGVTYQRLGNREEAVRYLDQTITRYPDSSAANLAKDYLTQI